MLRQPMRLPYLTQSSPLRLLLRLEWLLLAIVLLVIPIVRIAPAPEAVLLNALGVILFAALGLILPTRGWQKLLYTASEFGLILLLALVGQIPLFQLLLIVLVIRNCLLFSGRDRTLITLLAFAACIFCLLNRRIFPFRVTPDQLGVLWFGSLLIFGLVILFLQLLVTAIMTERQSREALATANTRLKQYALKVEELATMQERNRIARDIHDSLGHSLTAFNFHLEAAIRLLHTQPTEAEALLLELKQLGSQTLAEVSQSVATLRADPLGGKGLTEAIALLVEQFQRSTGILPQTELQIPSPLSQAYNLVIYRIVQESLTNSCKYAQATQVRIRIEPTASGIQIQVQDNGNGFDLTKNTTGFGLQGMGERVESLAGTLKIITAPGQGCQVLVSLPLHSPIR